MKFFLALAAILACTATLYADEESERVARQERIITGQIEEAIEGLRQQIIDNGWDPLDIDRREAGISIPPDTEEIKALAVAQNVRSNGLSNIVIERIDFSLFAARLQLTLALPRVDASVGFSQAEIDVFGHHAAARAYGRAAINALRVAADVRLNISIISGISLRSLAIDLTLGGIESQLSVQVLDRDLSDTINNLLGNTIPNGIANNRETINRVLENILRPIIEENLP